MYLLARAKLLGARVIAGTYAPRNWLYSRDAAAALCGLALSPHLAHRLYNVTPNEDCEPMQWARHLRVELAGETAGGEGPVVELAEEISQLDDRAPTANDRIRAVLPAWPAYGPEAAFHDYADWLESHHQFS
jgi:nucleoside-diphosphate-sugar epimerase